MKTYEMLLHGPATNDYIKGRISGIIHVLTGMPEKQYVWMGYTDNPDLRVRFDATQEQCEAIRACIGKLYSKAFMGVRVVE